MHIEAGIEESRGGGFDMVACFSAQQEQKLSWRTTKRERLLWQQHEHGIYLGLEIAPGRST
jgi:hypothetical protein